MNFYEEKKAEKNFTFDDKLIKIYDTSLDDRRDFPNISPLSQQRRWKRTKSRGVFVVGSENSLRLSSASDFTIAVCCFSPLTTEKRFMLKICINRFAKSFAFNSWSCSTEECCYSEEVSRKLKIFDNNFFEGYILWFFKSRNLISEAHNKICSLRAGLKEFEFVYLTVC